LAEHRSRAERRRLAHANRRRFLDVQTLANQLVGARQSVSALFGPASNSDETVSDHPRSDDAGDTLRQYSAGGRRRHGRLGFRAVLVSGSPRGIHYCWRPRASFDCDGCRRTERPKDAGRKSRLEIRRRRRSASFDTAD